LRGGFFIEKKQVAWSREQVAKNQAEWWRPQTCFEDATYQKGFFCYGRGEVTSPSSVMMSKKWRLEDLCYSTVQKCLTITSVFLY
jgi:hypothetical protein